jgi:hypothetical protein
MTLPAAPRRRSGVATSAATSRSSDASKSSRIVDVVDVLARVLPQRLTRSGAGGVAKQDRCVHAKALAASRRLGIRRSRDPELPGSCTGGPACSERDL